MLTSDLVVPGAERPHRQRQERATESRCLPGCRGRGVDTAAERADRGDRLLSCDVVIKRSKEFRENTGDFVSAKMWQHQLLLLEKPTRGLTAARR